ncbi:hypothetical protein PACTADRAFT_49775 [Pachysolen tannophilus NRRL Y-2460]|uniref:Ubiquitin-conjugating enzyme E2 6 n=1 Tax=Pachysolen tannophilus NRRL Y-2460 TaxID=669874 RepID=A0A1E4TXG5_PACTA|nr:hypothetical protein PACTADRAFT_49775 [Pachysolen tannophilus NRRL Y-2460]
MASKQSQKRLAKEYKAIQSNPPQYIIAKPSEENILEWHYIISGPPDTPYFNGQYHGTLHFPSEYPFKPPSIMMVTPNGRFKTNTRLCLSMSDFHPDTWNPSWSVSTILVGLLSFMTGDEATTGAIRTDDDFKKNCALNSLMYNITKNNLFIKNFPELIEKNRQIIKQRHEQDAKNLQERLNKFQGIQGNLNNTTASTTSIINKRKPSINTTTGVASSNNNNSVNTNKEDKIRTEDRNQTKEEGTSIVLITLVIALIVIVSYWFLY